MININEFNRRLSNMENQVKMLIENISKDKQYMNYDIEAGRVNTLKAQRSADDANTLARENEGCILEVADIASENDGCILDLASIASENDSAILELAEYVAALEERITALEGGTV